MQKEFVYELKTHFQGQGDSRAIVADQLGPPRCHSVGSLMELDQLSTERRKREFEKEKRRGSGGDAKDAPKRKLEEGNCNFMVLKAGLVFMLC